MAQSKRNKLGKQLLGMALDNYFAFSNQEIEDALDRAILKYEGKSADWRKQVRLYLWSNSQIRNLICEEAMRIYE